MSGLTIDRTAWMWPSAMSRTATAISLPVASVGDGARLAVDLHRAHGPPAERHGDGTGMDERGHRGPVLRGLSSRRYGPGRWLARSSSRRSPASSPSSSAGAVRAAGAAALGDRVSTRVSWPCIDPSPGWCRDGPSSRRAGDGQVSRDRPRLAVACATTCSGSSSETDRGPSTSRTSKRIPGSESGPTAVGTPERLAWLADDDARRRLMSMNPINSLFIWIAGTDLATIRIDLDADRQQAS